MNKRIGLIIGLGAAALALSVGGNSRAAGINLCTGGAPNATITVASGASAESVSPDGTYVSNACRGYVVDVKVSVNSANYSFVTDGEVANVTTKAACDVAQDHVNYYRKAAGGTTFNAVGGGTRRGVWQAGTALMAAHCQMQGIAGFQNRNAAFANGDTWRIIVQGFVGGAVSRVKVSGSSLGIAK